MRLMDSIAASRLPLHVELPGKGTFALPNASAIAGEIGTAPLRYILDDAVAAVTARAAYSDPEQLLDCLELLHIPASPIWLEWSERGRCNVIKELGLDDPLEGARTDGRAGMLVVADKTGRRGSIRVAWDNESDGFNSSPPDMSPFMLAFDFDNPSYASPVENCLVRAVRFPQSETLSMLAGHLRFELDPAWCAYYAAACPTASAFEEVLNANLKVVAADFQFLAAFFLLLMARNAVDLAPVHLGKLNAARAKRGKQALLDHIEVKAHLGGSMRQRDDRDASARNPRRLHFVAGHLVRRGAQIFWRRAHLRGNPARGVITARTIVVMPPRAAATAEAA